MRLVLVLVASLVVSACDNGRKVMDILFGVTEAEEEERAGYGPDPAYDEEGGLAGGGEAADLAHDPVAAAGDDESCAGTGEAEGFVRCVYAGLDSGAVDLSQPSDIHRVWGGTEAELAEYLAYPAEFRAQLVQTQRSTLCACPAPDAGRFGIRAVSVRDTGADRAEARVRLENGGTVVIELERQAGIWSFEDAR